MFRGRKSALEEISNSGLYTKQVLLSTDLKLYKTRRIFLFCFLEKNIYSFRVKKVTQREHFHIKLSF